VNIGDVRAFDSATPVLVFGSAGTVTIAGGNLEQANAQPQGVSLPAQVNAGVFEADGVDITDLLVTP
jgi:hypothetical protein